MESKFHTFAQPIQSIPLPERFTYPFHYTPHPLCVIAAEETQAYLKERTEWREELQTGKMFGVLVVRTPAGEVGYLAAFSGNLAGKNVHPFFVPPIYDLLQPDGFFRQEEEQINEINARIRTQQASPALEDARSRLQSTIEYCDFVLQAAKDLMKKRKEERDRLRQFPLTEEETALLIKESQHMKAAHKLTKKSLRSILEEDQAKVDRLEQEIEQLKQERKRRSAALQRKLFEQFRILNARGEVKDLCELFAPTSQGTPPAGAGECAAPKLLQYAYQHQLEPIAMAEFWWGDSPKTEIRHHGYYYPACKGKCEPILHHMLQGLRVIRYWRTLTGRRSWISFMRMTICWSSINRKVCSPSPAREMWTLSIKGYRSFTRKPPVQLSYIAWIWRHPACYSPPRPKKRIRTYKPNSRTEPSRKGISPY